MRVKKIVIELTDIEVYALDSILQEYIKETDIPRNKVYVKRLLQKIRKSAG